MDITKWSVASAKLQEAYTAYLAVEPDGDWGTFVDWVNEQEAEAMNYPTSDTKQSESSDRERCAPDVTVSKLAQTVEILRNLAIATPEGRAAFAQAQPPNEQPAARHSANKRSEHS